MKSGEFGGVIRAPFLLLTPMCVLVGVAVAVWEGAEINPISAVLVLVGALAAHISADALNEYLDFRSGLDFHTEKTPFSGGSGTLVNNPKLAGITLWIGIVALVVTMLVGIWFLMQQGWALLPIGLLGVVIIVTYTQWINRNRFLCLIAPGLGFGPLMVLGTYYVLTGGFSLTAAFASLVPFFLVNNLLLLNQIPDIEADKKVGRDTFPIAYGVEASIRLYGVFNLLAFAVLAVGVLAGWFPWYVLIVIPIAILAFRTIGGARDAGANIELLLPHMRSNVLVALLTPFLFSIGFFLS